jgi:uncharacterized protein
MNKIINISFLIVISIVLTGCAGAMRNYDREMSGTLSHIQSGNLDESLKEIESNNKFGDKDLLYFLEKSEILSLNGKKTESLEFRLLADEKIKNWEQEARFNPQVLLGNVGSVVVNDKVRRYDGRDYEKVFLNNRLAVNHLQLGDWEKARVEIKKMHEREAIIAEFRAKEIEDAEKKASEKGITTTYNDLAGYPVGLLNDPAVVALKNGYQNAFSHYLAGFIYESLGEKSLAAAGYRQAIELRPDVELLKEALINLDGRSPNLVKENKVIVENKASEETKSQPKSKLKTKTRTSKNNSNNDLVATTPSTPVDNLNIINTEGSTNQTDTLIIFETGTAPSFKSVQIPIPLPLAGQVGVTPISFPVIETHSDNAHYTKVAVGNESVGLAEVVDFNLMAKRALKDEMPGIVTRSIVRAISKAIAQQAANQQDDSGVTGLILLIGGLIMEGADERTWRTLPSTISIGRARFNEGTYKISADSPFGKIEQELKISGKSKIILVRQLGNTVSFQTSKTFDEAKTEMASNEALEKPNNEEAKAASENKEKPNLMRKWLDKLNIKKTE